MKNFLLGIIFTFLALIAVGVYLMTQGYVNLRADQAPSALESKVAMAAIDAWAARFAPHQANPAPPHRRQPGRGRAHFLESLRRMPRPAHECEFRFFEILLPSCAGIFQGHAGHG